MLLSLGVGACKDEAAPDAPPPKAQGEAGDKKSSSLKPPIFVPPTAPTGKAQAKEEEVPTEPGPLAPGPTEPELGTGSGSGKGSTPPEPAEPAKESKPSVVGPLPQQALLCAPKSLQCSPEVILVTDTDLKDLPLRHCELSWELECNEEPDSLMVDNKNIATMIAAKGGAEILRGTQKVSLLGVDPDPLDAGSCAVLSLELRVTKNGFLPSLISHNITICPALFEVQLTNDQQILGPFDQAKTVGVHWQTNLPKVCVRYPHQAKPGTQAFQDLAVLKSDGLSKKDLAAAKQGPGRLGKKWLETAIGGTEGGAVIASCDSGPAECFWTDSEPEIFEKTLFFEPSENTCIEYWAVDQEGQMHGRTVRQVTVESEKLQFEKCAVETVTTDPEQNGGVTVLLKSSCSFKNAQEFFIVSDVNSLGTAYNLEEEANQFVATALEDFFTEENSLFIFEVQPDQAGTIDGTWSAVASHYHHRFAFVACGAGEDDCKILYRHSLIPHPDLSAIKVDWDIKGVSLNGRIKNVRAVPGEIAIQGCETSVNTVAAVPEAGGSVIPGQYDITVVCNYTGGEVTLTFDYETLLGEKRTYEAKHSIPDLQVSFACEYQDCTIGNSSSKYDLDIGLKVTLQGYQEGAPYPYQKFEVVALNADGDETGQCGDPWKQTLLMSDNKYFPLDNEAKKEVAEFTHTFPDWGMECYRYLLKLTRLDGSIQEVYFDHAPPFEFHIDWHGACESEKEWNGACDVTYAYFDLQLSGSWVQRVDCQLAGDITCAGACDTSGVYTPEDIFLEAKERVAFEQEIHFAWTGEDGWVDMPVTCTAYGPQGQKPIIKSLPFCFDVASCGSCDSYSDTGAHFAKSCPEGPNGQPISLTN